MRISSFDWLLGVLDSSTNSISEDSELISLPIIVGWLMGVTQTDEEAEGTDGDLGLTIVFLSKISIIYTFSKWKCS